MIVVIGAPIGRIGDGVVKAAGMAARIALAAAGAGRTVQLVGKTGDDPTADGVVLDLSRGGVGHVALLRDPSRSTPLEMASPLAAPDDDAGFPDDAGAPIATPDAGPMEGPALEAGDVDLGLRYLTEFAVVVLAEPVTPEIVAVVAEAARWSEARMVLVVRAGEAVLGALPDDVVVFEAPDLDPDGSFASVVGTFAAALDAGTDPREAFQASIASDGWTGTEPG